MKKLFVLAFAAVALVSVGNVFALGTVENNAVANPTDSAMVAPVDTVVTEEPAPAETPSTDQPAPAEAPADSVVAE